VVGAGGSLEVGVPSVAALTEKVWDALDRIQLRVAVPRSEPAARVLRRLLDEHFKPANFEHVLHALEALDSMRTSSSPGTVPRFRIVEAALAGGIRIDLAGIIADDLWVDAAARQLFEVLHDEIVAGTNSAAASPRWPAFAALWQQLESAFDLHVVTLNYDQLVEGALGWSAHEQGFAPVTGESVQRFDAYQRPPRLIHLHGNVSFGYRGGSADVNRFRFEDGWHDLYMHPSPATARASWGRRSQPSSQAGRHTIIGPLITGMEKTSKLLIEPYATYQRHAGNLVADHPRVLVVGYGFGDPHITTLINKIGRIHGPNRRVALVDFTPGEDGDDEWRGMTVVWGSERLELQRSVYLLAAEESPLDVFSSREVWTSRDGRFRVHLCGFTRVATHHAANLIAFLSQP
jgi:hypothetical protein